MDKTTLTIKQAADRGHTRAAIIRLLGVTKEQVDDALGLEDAQDNTPARIMPSSPTDEITPATLARLGNEGLYSLASDALANPQAYKPNEALAIFNHCLDRGLGKPRQEHELKGNAVIHIIGAVPAPHSQMEVIEHDPK